LETHERRKRRREAFQILGLILLIVLITFTEIRMYRLSPTTDFANSIFFFGLLNINIILLGALVWLIFKNVGKLFLERRRDILGSRLKTKLVLAFLAFSIIPTVILFIISALYINSSFDKWFSLRIQNTFQASLEITRVYYRNTEQTAMHFAEHLAQRLGKNSPVALEGVEEDLRVQRDLLALDAIEFYSGPLDPRILTQRQSNAEGLTREIPFLPLDLLNRAFDGEKLPAIQHIGSGDLIRCLVPVYLNDLAGDIGPQRPLLMGVVVVSSYIPVSLVNEVDKIASVSDDYKESNPLKYPIKTTYFVILVMITLLILFVAIWIGLYMARELTVPVERLVLGAREVGAGNLDVKIQASGQDEISVLIQSFNKMITDLRENRESLSRATEDLEKRRLQLEAILSNIGTGVISVDSHGLISTANAAVNRIFGTDFKDKIGQRYTDALKDEFEPLSALLDRAFSLASESAMQHREAPSELTQWNYRFNWSHGQSSEFKTLGAVATSLRESESTWGVVVVIDDMTHLVKGQREMAWREVARRIAHEIKNPLTPIKLSAQRLHRRLGQQAGQDASLVRECTETIIKYTDELKEMVNEFSNFARLPEINPSPGQLNDAIQEVVKLYRQGHADIQFVVKLDSHLPVFEFDREQMKRVLVNLMENSVSALQSSPASERDRVIKIDSHYNESLQMAVVDVSDNGPGMPEDVRSRLFEPYFSTKREGTGLGLSITKRIVNDHNGYIRVYSSPGEGTRFLIELPTSPKTKA